MPSIVSPALLVLDSWMAPRVGESVMVCGVAKDPVVSNTTVLGAAVLGARFAALKLVLRFAQVIAERRVPISCESTVVLTR